MTKHRHTTLWRLLAALVALTLVAAACGEDDAEPDSAPDAESDTGTDAATETDSTPADADAATETDGTPADADGTSTETDDPSDSAEPSAVDEGFSYAAAAAPYAGTTIRVLDEITDLQPTVAQLVPEFEELTGINVEFDLQGHVDVIVVGEADLYSGGGEYDAVMLHDFQVPAALQSGQVLLFDEFLANDGLKSPTVNYEDFVNPGSEALTLYGDNRVCFNTWNYNQVWWGRRDILEHPDEQAAFEAAYGYPLAPPETWQQAHDVAEFLTRESGETLAGETLNKRVAGFFLQGSQIANYTEVWFTFIRQFGGDLFDSEGNPTADRPENIEATEFWASFFDFAPDGAVELSLLDMPVLMANGDVVSGIGWSDFMFGIDNPDASPHAGNFTFRGIPSNADAPDLHFATSVPSCPVIAKSSDNPEATFLFLQWLVEQSTQDAWLELVNSGVGGFVPTRSASVDPLSDSPRAELYAAMLDSLGHASTFPHLGNYAELTNAMALRFQEVLLGKSASDALADLQSDLEDICGGTCTVVTGG